MLKLHTFVFNLFSENTYLLWDDSSKEAMIVDPGCGDPAEENLLANFIIENELNLKYLVNTHCHIDHVLGNAFVKSKFNPIFLAPEKDLPLLKKVVDQGKIFDIDVQPSPEPDQFIDEKLKIELGNYSPKFILTPGHTPGEYCIFFNDANLCITGDVLFYEGIGRTDLWGGDYKTLINSIQSKLFVLPDETLVYPGHGNSSTIGHEKQHNPFVG